MVIMLMFAFCAFIIFGRSTALVEYLGCFQIDNEDLDLPIPVIITITSPSECINACKALYFMYAGLTEKSCYCGSKYGKHGPSNSCNINCIDDVKFLCGSNTAISIYGTGQKGPSPPRIISLERRKPSDLVLSWLYPDVPNGNITSYTIRAVPVKTYSSKTLAPFESQVEGGFSNTTVLNGLEPGTNYNVSVVATNGNGDSLPAIVSNWTYIGPADEPPAPKILDLGQNTIKISIERGYSENGPVSSYQIVVVDPGIIPPKRNDESYPDYTNSRDEGLGYYVTAAFDASDYDKYKIFTVGNGRSIGGYYNAPFNVTEIPPQIGLVVVSKIGDEVQYSYSNLTKMVAPQTSRTSSKSTVTVLLWIGIVLLGVLLVTSIFVYFFIRKKFERGQKRFSDHQELTLQGPLVEVDNIAYIPEDVPECTNHYQELKNKVWTIPRNFITIDTKVIRRGRFGTVHMGTVLKDGKNLPTSIHSITDVSMKSSEKKQMLRELDVCIKAGAMEYLAGLIGTCETLDTLYISLELPTETLKNRLLSSRFGNPFPANKITAIGAAVASALQYLSRMKIVHNFVCARAVGLDDNLNPKLMGHGISKYSLEDMKFARWTATECFSSRIKHHPGTIWSFGILLWEMFSLGGTPYSNLTLESEVEEAVEQGVRLPQLKDIPDPIYEVMLSCWSIDLQERPHFDELVRLNILSCCPVITSVEPYLPELELNY